MTTANPWLTATTLDTIVARIEGMPKALLDDAAPELAKVVKAEIMATIAAHTSPGGVPWAPRKKGEAPVLENAAEWVGVENIGRVIWMRVRGANARHHRGAIKGRVRRPIILTSTITPRIADAMHAVLAKRFQEQASG